MLIFTVTSLSLLVLREVTVKMSIFNPMKHEVYANNTLTL